MHRPTVESNYSRYWEEYEVSLNFGPSHHRTMMFTPCVIASGTEMAINLPPGDGHMAFVCSPDGISIEPLKWGDSLPPTEPRATLEYTGEW